MNDQWQKSADNEIADNLGIWFAFVFIVALLVQVVRTLGWAVGLWGFPW